MYTIIKIIFQRKIQTVSQLNKIKKNYMHYMNKNIMRLNKFSNRTGITAQSFKLSDKFLSQLNKIKKNYMHYMNKNIMRLNKFSNRTGITAQSFKLSDKFLS
jgi:tetrahydromethanopterin S-methyltransferase subunit B